jgi:hypothetical protein
MPREVWTALGRVLSHGEVPDDPVRLLITVLLTPRVPGLDDLFPSVLI